MASHLRKMWSEMDQFTRKLLKGEYASCPDLEDGPQEAGAVEGRSWVSFDTGLQDTRPPEHDEHFVENEVMEDEVDLNMIQPLEEVKMTSSEEELNNILNERALYNYDLEIDDMYSEMSEMCRPVSFPSPPVNVYLSTFQQLQIESLYKGLKSKVYVCSCAASLYFSSAVQPGEWDFQQTGVPVVVVENHGATNILWLYLAELGTGLPYWKDVLDYNSSYSRSDLANFHYWRMSQDRRVKAGLTFDCEGSASSFWLHVCCVTSRLENLGVSLPKSDRKIPRRDTKPKNKPPSKEQISSPCCFVHITSVHPLDRDRYKSLQSLVTAAPPEELHGICTSRV